jgi:hypothetical protein
MSKISAFAAEIEHRGKLNLLDQHLHAENFYLHFFNLLFGWELENLNTSKQNVAGIDLIDHTNRVVMQVSATATKAKIEAALSKDLSAYTGYSFKFISISKDASALRSLIFTNPHNLTFNPQTDIFDVASILRVVLALGIDEQRQIYAFIKKELGTDVEPQKLESNLATIINILSREDWSQQVSTVETTPFDIVTKIDFNDLHAARGVIDDYTIHHSRVDRIYTDFDKAGVNKSTSVLNAMRHDYFAHKDRLSSDDLFFKVIECVAERVQVSTNYSPIPYEELELCVNILVVDSFIRCKIFKNPEGYANAAS